MNFKTYSVDSGLLRYATNMGLERHIYVYNNLHVISCAAGCISWEYEILKICQWSGLSARSVKESLRWLMKNGFVEKWGRKWHVRSKYAVREMIGYEETGQVKLKINEIKKKYTVWKANAIQYIKGVHIRIQAAMKRSEKRTTTQNYRKGVPSEPGNYYPYCSYRQAEVLTGKSISYLHKQTSIQDVAVYKKRWCPLFDELEVKTLKRLNEYISANEEFCRSMFEFDKRKKIFRKRKADAIYVKFESCFRKTPDKYKYNV